MEAKPPLDFFISYAHADEEWAVWIAWQLEEAGHTTRLMAWDFLGGQNFVLAMQQAVTEAKQTVAVLSPDYLDSEFANAEWAEAFAADPTGKQRKLLPIKVKPVDATGFLNTRITIDLTGVAEEKAKQRLLDRIRASKDGIRQKPGVEPPFPGAALAGGARAATHDPKPTAFENSHDFKAGQVDKVEQVREVCKRMGDAYFVKAGANIQPLAFILHGESSQWPYAFVYILYYVIKKHLKSQQYPPERSSPEPKPLTGKVYEEHAPEDYLWELVGEELDCGHTRTEIQTRLAKETTHNIFYLPLASSAPKNPVFMRRLLEAWESLDLPPPSPRHILIVFYEQSAKPKSWLCRWRTRQSMLDELQKLLPQGRAGKSILPGLESPNQRLVHEWIDGHINPSDAQKAKDHVKTCIEKEFKQRKANKTGGKEQARRIRVTQDDYEIHHYDLKDILIDALRQFG